MSATRTPSRPPRRRWEIVPFVVVLLVLAKLAWVLAQLALDNHHDRWVYEKRAVVTTATVTGFQTFWSRTRDGSTAHALPIVKFKAADGQELQQYLVLAPAVPHAERAGWVGRAIEIRYPPGRPDLAIASDAIDQLPSVTAMLAWLGLVAASAVACLAVMARVLRKARHRAELH